MAKRIKKITQAEQFIRATTFIYPTRYPIAERFDVLNHIGVSGGKDSTALLIWALRESDYPRDSIVASFSDTGNESSVTYRYIDYLEDALQIGIIRVKPPKDFFELAKWKRRFPGAKARFCTQFLKIYPTAGLIRHLEARCKTLVLHSGVRAAESAARADLTPETFDPVFGHWVKRPLLTWSIGQIWDYHHAHGIKPNPLYAAGMSRVGCFPCIMSRKSEIRRIATLFPEAIDRIREEEKISGGAANGNYSSFFPAKTVPVHQCSRTYVNCKGKTFRVATIDDVVRWSWTARGGKHRELDLDGITKLSAEAFNWEELPRLEEKGRSCPAGIGLCE
ncbi:MAG TPA: phosphoadenosine phosphosulfate reductase family protein [Chthoniobacteraceae bacterium]|nr:phosphoadenosine phosphosulfate reductase family protein [Chthoniobacteraceae bacterium]